MRMAVCTEKWGYGMRVTIAGDRMRVRVGMIATIATFMYVAIGIVGVMTIVVTIMAGRNGRRRCRRFMGMVMTTMTM